MEQRLIDANVLQIKPATISVVNDYGSYYVSTDVVFKDDIDNAPTVDPVEHGHIVWRERERKNTKFEKGRCLKCGKDTVVELSYPDVEKIPFCSKCGKRVGDTFWSFCPNCGVCLDEEEEFINIGEG